MMLLLVSKEKPATTGRVAKLNNVLHCRAKKVAAARNGNKARWRHIFDLDVGTNCIAIGSIVVVGVVVVVLALSSLLLMSEETTYMLRY